MIQIAPNALYRRNELHKLLGRAAFAQAAAAGLRAVGDLYLGQKVLDALALAQDNKVGSQRAVEKKGAVYEETAQLETSSKDRGLQRVSRRPRADDFLRSVEKS